MLLARLVPSFKEAMFLSQSGLIFINGIEQKFHRTAIRLGDVIQLGISDLFYKFYR